MKIFISGKITNNPNYKKDFKRAEAFLKLNDYEPINPVETTETITFFDWSDLMDICFKLIEMSDGVYFLKNWKESKGSRIEHAFAVSLEKEIFYE